MADTRTEGEFKRFAECNVLEGPAGMKLNTCLAVLAC